ncbi:MAG: hypothetical protein A2W98_00975 [Bacteroidetes bacterium GWF2_33_38]|nr:MAG: hypothetical protein A2W98_00975 [Bacteroidetes bacterium GWF2_33_38]HBX50633.1 peptidylarginine deiminase [Bacteroidales bacterium]
MTRLYSFIVALLICTCAFSQEQIKSTFQGKHHMLSTDELEKGTKSIKSFNETAPPSGTVRAIAEFEPMQAVIVTYLVDEWYGDGYFGIPVDLISSYSETVKVITIVEDGAQQADVLDFYSTNGVNTANCEFFIAPADSYWSRDYSPWFVAVNNEICVLDFPYDRPSRPNDDEIPVEFANAYGLDIYGMDLMQTGGNFMCDGMYAGASTDLVEEENETLTTSAIQTKIEDYMGINNYHITADPLGDYIKHIDCWGKFLDVDKILIGQVATTNSQYSEYEAMAEYWSNQISSYGTNYQVFRTYSPNGQPYTNSLILNNRVFVPIVDGTGSTWNDDAIAVYQTAMPGYEVIGFYENPETPWESTDALHCRAHEVPDFDMLHIFHMPTLNNVTYATQYTIEAEIIPYSSATVTSAVLRYQVNGGVFSEVSMSNIGGSTYRGIIPELPENSEVGYYIHAETNTSKTSNHPYIGAPDPHVFVIGMATGILSQVTNVSFRVYPNPADNEIFVNIFSDIECDVNLSIFDITGKEMLSDSYQVHAGNVIKAFDVSGFSKGVYLVKVISGNNVLCTNKISIQ